jgi:hypothetical protein
MIRRVWTGSIASVVASVGLATGQSAPVTATDGASTGVFTFKTSGQTERKVQVLKTERLPDGKYLTEVKDLATGAIFSIADSKPLGSMQPESKPLPMATPAPTNVTGSAMLPGTMVPVKPLPAARSRASDPLMPGANAATIVPVNSGMPTTEYPTLVGKLRGHRSTPVAAAPQPVTINSPYAAPQPAKKQSSLHAALFGRYDEAPSQPTTLVGRMTGSTTQPTTTAMPGPATAISTPPAPGIRQTLLGHSNSAVPTQETPTLVGKLFGDKPIPVATAPLSQGVIRPSAVASSNSRIMPVAAVPAALSAETNPVLTPLSVMPPSVPAVPVSGPVSVPVQPASYTPTSTDSRDPNFHVIPAKAMTMKQIEEQVKELRMNQRPSKRMEAANALAAGPMSGMVEVRQVLAEATYRDPVGVVRAHCIEILAKMKYDEANYLKYVETLVNDEEPAVSRAARAAMKVMQ